MCLERPIITNPTGDAKHLFEKYKLGILCPDTPESYYDILKGFIEGRIKTEACTQDSRFVAHQVISFDKRIDQMLEIFTDLIESHNLNMDKPHRDNDIRT